jgi:hypothetical protein
MNLNLWLFSESAGNASPRCVNEAPKTNIKQMTDKILPLEDHFPWIKIEEFVSDRKLASTSANRTDPVENLQILQNDDSSQKDSQDGKSNQESPKMRQSTQINGQGKRSELSSRGSQKKGLVKVLKSRQQDRAAQRRHELQRLKDEINSERASSKGSQY